MNKLRVINSQGGTFAIYKPKGPTSYEIVEIVRKLVGLKKVGHAGTLDPLAKGILVIGIGRESTRRLKEITSRDKEYITTIRLGMESATDDEEGDKKEIAISRIPSLEEIKRVVGCFIGQYHQVPPAFSAVKIKGKEAYKLARQGKSLLLKPRLVKIKEIKIYEYDWPYLKLKVVSGPGVYIRALARDIGRTLKTGGYVFELERTRVGEFSKKEALEISELQEKSLPHI